MSRHRNTRFCDDIYEDIDQAKGTYDDDYLDEYDDKTDRRLDPHDGQPYTKKQFIHEYGGTKEWDAARPEFEEAKEKQGVLRFPVDADLQKRFSGAMGPEVQEIKDRYEVKIAFQQTTGNVKVNGPQSKLEKAQEDVEALLKKFLQREKAHESLKRDETTGGLAQQVLEAWPTLDTQKPLTVEYHIDKSVHPTLQGKKAEIDKRFNYGKNAPANYDAAGKMIGDTWLHIPPKFDPSNVVSVTGPAHKVEGAVKTMNTFLGHFKIMGSVQKVTRSDQEEAKRKEKEEQDAKKKKKDEKKKAKEAAKDVPPAAPAAKGVEGAAAPPAAAGRGAGVDAPVPAGRGEGIDAAGRGAGIAPSGRGQPTEAAGRGTGIEAAPAGRGAGVEAAPAGRGAGVEAAPAGRGAGVEAAPAGRGAGVEAAPAGRGAGVEAAPAGRGAGVEAAPAGRGAGVEAAPAGRGAGVEAPPAATGRGVAVEVPTGRGAGVDAAGGRGVPTEPAPAGRGQTVEASQPAASQASLPQQADCGQSAEPGDGAEAAPAAAGVDGAGSKAAPGRGRGVDLTQKNAGRGRGRGQPQAGPTGHKVLGQRDKARKVRDYDEEDA